MNNPDTDWKESAKNDVMSIVEMFKVEGSLYQLDLVAEDIIKVFEPLLSSQAEKHQKAVQKLIQAQEEGERLAVRMAEGQHRKELEDERLEFYKKLLIIMASSDPNKTLMEYIDEYSSTGDKSL